MAKSPFILYGAKGKVGNVVAQKGAYGGTILREYVKPSNPKTAKQNAQRIVFATVVQAAQKLKPLVDHAFENVPYGVRSINRFSQLNLKMLRNAAAVDFEEGNKASESLGFYTTKGISALIPNRYIVSQGSLSELKPFIDKDTTKTVTEGQLMFKLPDKFTVDLVRNEDGGLDVRLGDIVRAAYGFTSIHEQLSLVSIFNSSDKYQFSFGDGDMAGWQIAFGDYNVMRLCMKNNYDPSRMIQVATVEAGVATLDESFSENVDTIFVDEIFDLEESAAPLVRFVQNLTGTAGVTITGSATDGWQLAFDLQQAANQARSAINNLYGDDTNYVCMAAGVIRSQLVDGKWRRSNCQLTMGVPYAGGRNNFGLDWNAAGQAWAAGVAAIADSADYLNEGGTRNQLGQDF